MSTCQRLSGRSKAAHTTSAGSRLSARKLAMRRAGASSAVEARDEGRAGWCWICFWRWSQRFMHAAAAETSTGIINRIYTGLSTACCRAHSRDISPTIHRTRMDAWTDKAACAEVIQAWGFARDQGRWDDLAGDLPSRRRDRGVVVSRALSGVRRALPAQFRPRQRGQASAVAGARRGERRARDRRDQRGDPGAPDHRGRGGGSDLQRPLPRPAREAATASGASSSARRCTRRTASIRSSRRRRSTR